VTRTVRGKPGFWHHSPLILASAGVHSAALVALAASPHSWPLALGVLAANHAAIAAASMVPRSRLLGPNLTRLPGPPPGVVALTFDDGPDPDVTPRVLALLEAAGVAATFFCIGRRAQQHPDLVAAIRARGHGIENHTFSHSSGFALGRSASMGAEVHHAQQALAAAGAARPRFFRAPAGMQNPWLPAVLAGEGLSLVSWTRRGFDTVTRDPRLVAQRLVKNLSAGDILLLHDGRSARTVGGAPVVLDALARVLDEMAARGLRSEALGAVLPTPVAGSAPDAG
jgi:peptidoglycan/xylan/chitin deacetylase (PgdA/CDA1 family)